MITMLSVSVRKLRAVPLEEQGIEICERKGLGQPDSICDAIMDRISMALCREYVKKLGWVAHHNIDKALLAAGEVENKFLGGIVKKPMLLIFGDRATFTVKDIDISVEEIAVQTAKNWLKKNLRFVDPEEHVKYQVELKHGSAALTDIFERREKQVLEANDTSAAVGYAPMTWTEKTVLGTEKFLNSKEFKKEFPETGEDIKVMGARRGNQLNLTISMAFVDKFIDNEATYFRRKDEVLEELRRFHSSQTVGSRKIFTKLNTLDRKRRGIKGLYLTVLGTSAEHGDCGQVGRGNRVNGIIPLNRPTCSEAAAGKNPVSHIGKIYSLLTFHIADQIYEKVPGVREVYVWLLSEIGRPINQPRMAAAQLVPEKSSIYREASGSIEEIIRSELDNIDKFCAELANGKVTPY